MGLSGYLELLEIFWFDMQQTGDLDAQVFLSRQDFRFDRVFLPLVDPFRLGIAIVVVLSFLERSHESHTVLVRNADGAVVAELDEHEVATSVTTLGLLQGLQVRLVCDFDF
jgi:hypothetical protein